MLDSCRRPSASHIRHNSVQNQSRQRPTEIVGWLKGLERRGLLTLESQPGSRRCVQQICDFADSLFPGLDATQSLTKYDPSTPHLGVHLVRAQDVPQYVSELRPQLLTWNRRSQNYGMTSRNFGAVKGLTFERVLIQPTGPIEKYLRLGRPELKDEARAKLYVAATRAKYSVGIVMQTAGQSGLNHWSSSA